MFKKTGALVISIILICPLFSIRVMATDTNANDNTPAQVISNELVVDNVTMIKDYVQKPAATDGTVKGALYDRTTNTLTLNNYNGKTIYAEKMGDDFKIVANGNNKITGEDTYSGMAIDIIDSKLTITGNGTTDVYAKYSESYTDSNAIYCPYLTFESTTMNVYAATYQNEFSYGIMAFDDGEGSIKVSGGNLNVICSNQSVSGGSVGILGRNIEVSGSGCLNIQAGLVNRATSCALGALYGEITVKNNGRLIAKGGDCSGDSKRLMSMGIGYNGVICLQDNGCIIASGGKCATSFGLYGQSLTRSSSSQMYGVSDILGKDNYVSKIKYYGGTLISNTKSDNSKALAINLSGTLSNQASDFLWRDNQSGQFKLNSVNAYFNSNKYKYVEIRDNALLDLKLSNLNLIGSDNALLGQDYHGTLSVTNGNYTLPNKINISINGVKLTQGYTYNPATGALIIKASVLKGTLTIEAVAVEKNAKTQTPSTTPLTGDHTNQTLWLILLLVSGIILVGWRIYKKHEK